MNLFGGRQPGGFGWITLAQGGAPAVWRISRSPRRSPAGQFPPGSVAARQSRGKRELVRASQGETGMRPGPAGHRAEPAAEGPTVRRASVEVLRIFDAAYG